MKKYWSFFRIRFLNGLQGDIDGAGDAALTVFLWCADVQQDGAGQGFIFPEIRIDVVLFEKIEKYHRSSFPPLCRAGRAVLACLL